MCGLPEITEPLLPPPKSCLFRRCFSDREDPNARNFFLPSKYKMSSVRSAYADVPKLPTRFSSLISPAYDDEIIVDGEIIRMPIPFTAVNGVLDINVTQSADVQTFVDNGDYPSDAPGLQ